MRLIKTTLAACLLLSQAAMADTVKLKNGDILTGSVVKKETDQLVFKTKYAGDINITWSEIETLSTDTPARVFLTDDSRFNATLKNKEPGRVQLVSEGEKIDADLALQDVSYINPSPAVSGEGVAWDGHANLGGAVRQGNTDNSAIRFDAEGVARTKQNRFTIGANVNRAKNKGESIEFNSRGYAKLDHFINKQLYVYGNGSLEHDQFRDISLRSNVGVGAGYQVYDTASRSLAVEGGLGYVNVDYGDAEDRNYANARWALRYNQLVFSTIQFFHNHELLVSLEDTENTLVFTKTGVRVPVAKNLNASMQLNLDYDNNPVGGRKKTDRGFFASLGYLW